MTSQSLKLICENIYLSSLIHQPKIKIMMIHSNRLLSSLICFCLAVLLTSCARNPVTGKKEVMFMSESQEIALGHSYDPQVVSMYGVYDDKKMQAFIEEKGKAMAAKSHRPDLPYSFKIMDTPMVNAFAVPGGYVYFTRGIMAHFNNEAEFAGVLGHEIGHIAARHSAKQQTNQILMQGGLMVGMIASEDFRQFGDVASQGLGLLSLKFGRDDETQSDILGVEYSTAIGYDAVEMADFFETLTRLSAGQDVPEFLSTHPNPANRFAKVKQIAKQKQAIYAGKKFAINRNEYLQMIDGLVYGDDPRQGFFENSTFYHPVLKFMFPVPQGWKLNNLPSQVQMAPEDGKAMMTLELVAGTDLNAVANKFVQDNQLTLIERSSTTVNGMTALALMTEQVPQADPNQQQQAPTLRILTYLISYNNAIYKFHGLSTQADFNRYFSSFQGTMKNFNRLTDSEKLNRKPSIIDIVTVKNRGTLQQALTGYGVKAADLERLAILNGMRLTDQLPAGTLIKIVGTMGAGQP